MFKSRLEFYSGFPVILSPNAAAVLKRAKLDGRKSDTYKDRYGHEVHVSGLDRNYHLYVLASRTKAIFGPQTEWNSEKLEVDTTVIFQTYPKSTELPVKVALDSSSPYQIPPRLRPSEVESVRVKPPEEGGLPLGLEFTHKDGSTVGLMLSPDLLHFLKFPDGHHEITDFIVEYVGIACGEKGNSDVFKRARAHEKVVEIQGDFQQRYGNRDLFIFAYDPGYIHALKNAPVVTSAKVLDRLVTGGRNSLYEAMEASLIAHFQPVYNVEFKDFPTKRPPWLRGTMYCLDGIMFGVDQICVTLASDASYNPDGAWTFGRFRSPSQRPETMHYIDVSV